MIDVYPGDYCVSGIFIVDVHQKFIHFEVKYVKIK